MTQSREFEAVSLWPGYETHYEIVRRLVSTQTEFQRLEICDTVTFGRALFLDHKIQSAESDEHIYHESLIHPAMIAHASPRSVYIAGAGEFATLREALRHQTVERVVTVDIDGPAMDFVQQHMHSWHQDSLKDPRARLEIGDARAYLADHEDRYDVVIVDVTDPVSGGPSYLLFTEEFYRLVASRLNPGGVLALQAESMALPLIDGHAAVVRTLRRVFHHVRDYTSFVPAFGEPWGFAIASNDVDLGALTAEEVEARLAARGIVGRHYDGTTHQHMFSLPKGVRDPSAYGSAVITDATPYILK